MPLPIEGVLTALGLTVAVLVALSTIVRWAESKHLDSGPRYVNRRTKHWRSQARVNPDSHAHR